MTLTEYVLKILPQPQVAAAAVRSAWSVLSTLVLGTAALYLYGDPIDEAVRTAGIAAAMGSGAGRILEGVWDARRAKSGNVKPWDVGQGNG